MESRCTSLHARVPSLSGPAVFFPATLQYLQLGRQSIISLCIFKIQFLHFLDDVEPLIELPLRDRFPEPRVVQFEILLTFLLIDLVKGRKRPELQKDQPHGNGVDYENSSVVQRRGNAVLYPCE